MSSAHLHSASLHVGREHSLYDKKRAELSFYASITLFSALFLSHCSLFYAQKKHETGFEPAALALARRCSTTEPLVHFLFRIYKVFNVPSKPHIEYHLLYRQIFLTRPSG